MESKGKIKKGKPNLTHNIKLNIVKKKNEETNNFFA